MIIHETKELLRKTEEVIFGIEDDDPRIIKKSHKIFNDHFIGYMFHGFNAWLITRTILLAIVFFVVLFLFSGFQMQYDYLMITFAFALLMAVICAPLVASRKSLDDDVKEDFIEKVSTYIRDKFYSALQVAAIEKNVEMMKNAFEIRMRIPRGLIGVFWACYIFYLTNHSLRFIDNGKIRILESKFVVVMFAGLLLLYVMERAFTRTVRRIYMTLSLALNEVAAEEV